MCMCLSVNVCDCLCGVIMAAVSAFAQMDTMPTFYVVRPEMEHVQRIVSERQE